MIHSKTKQKKPAKTVWNKEPKAKAKKPTKKSEASKLKTRVRKLDKLMSLYIRMSYADRNGMVTCVSCWKSLHRTEAHCAHFIDRAKMWTRFMEDNLRPACCWCNTFNTQFHIRMYTVKLIEEKGLDFVNNLITIGSNIKQWKAYELEEIYNTYKPLVEKLEWSLLV